MILSDTTEVRASPEAVFGFFDEIDTHYLRWHPDHKLFRWVRGRGLREGVVFYFEETINGKLLKKEVVFTQVRPGEYIEFVPTFWLMRLILPRMSFRLQALEGGMQRVTAEIHLRMGPLARWANRRDLAAVREHMRVEGVNLKSMLETGVPAITAARQPQA